MMMVKSELRHSAVHGIGVFATDLIPKGTLVWKLDERFYVMLNQSELEGLPPLMREHFQIYSWPHMTRKGVLVCDIDNGRFMNHSDDANTVFKDPVDAWAIRDIQVGEEITCNYSEFDDGFKPFK